jgi:hypothetical protein
MLYDPNYMKYLEQANLHPHEGENWLLRSGEGWKNGKERTSSYGDKNGAKLTVVISVHNCLEKN